VTSSATTTIDINSGNVVDLTMASNITTLAFSNVPASGTPIQLVIVFRNDAAGTDYQVTWPSSIYWNSVGGATNSLVGPRLTLGPNSVTIVSLLTTDGGTKWRGWVESTIYGGTTNNLYTWGSNSDGVLGLSLASNTSGVRSSPTQVGGATWAQIEVGAYNDWMVGLTSAGTLFSWGDGTSGQSGRGNVLDVSSPVQIGSSTNWATVSAGARFGVALTNDGQLWTWGTNSDGQLGTSASYTTVYLSPVRVGPNTNWAKVNAGRAFVTAITTSGALFAWGFNGNGNLGLGNTVSRSSPVQVGTNTNWASTSGSANHTLAVTTTGQLWSWGQNNNGGLGLNNRTNYSSPKQVGTDTNWAKVNARSESSSMAITTAGALFTWGSNAFGELGQNDRVNRSSPTQVGGLTWAKLPSSTNDSSTGAITTAGELFTWGWNNVGNLGLNDRVSRSSPTQVGADTDWIALNISNGSSAGLRGPVSTINPA
jgi:alpha-tubulin suppressor-like RCC1 family protein